MPPSTRRRQISGSWSTRAPNMSMRWPPVILVYRSKSRAISPIRISCSGVISPPGTAAPPSSCRSSGCWPGSGRWCPAATPARRRGCARSWSTPGSTRPRVCRCRNPFRCRSVRSGRRRCGSEVAATISNSSARDWLKCSHSALDCSTPSASSSCLSSGTHEPHEVPACVHFFRPGDVAAAAGDGLGEIALGDVVARADLRGGRQRADAQIRCAAVGPAGAISASGSPGSCSPTIGRSTPYADASPTRMPPSSVLASSESTSLA